MLKKSWPRLGALVALLLSGVLLLASPVFARTITVDGNPADWVGSSILPIADANEPLNTVDVLDISEVYYTYNPTNLYFRIDSYSSPTGYPIGGFALICLNTDNNLATGGAIDQCEATGSQNGVDYVIQVFPAAGQQFIRQCPNAVVNYFACPPIGAPAFATQNNVSEFGIPLASIGITNVACIGGQYDIITSVYLDNGTGDPDDLVPDTGEFTITLACPLPVTLTSFTATRADAGVELAWASSSELNIQGYHVLRSAGDRAAATRITDALIPGTGTGITGDSYSYTDTTAAVGSSYSYWLEVVNSDGTPEEYGPVSYAPGTAQRTSVYLPLVVR